MKITGRLAMAPFVLLLFGAAPAEQLIPFPGGYGEALIMPAASPVRFSGFNKEGEQYVGARFSGRFVLTGRFSWGCNWDCDGSSPISERDNSP